MLEAQLPKVEPESRGSVVILRLRGIDELGLSFVAVFDRCLTDLEQNDSALWFMIAGEQIRSQLKAGGLLERLGPIASTRARSGSARPCTARMTMPRNGCVNGGDPLWRCHRHQRRDIGPAQSRTASGSASRSRTW